MQIMLAFLLAGTLESGEPIPVGTADRLGPLSPGLSLEDGRLILYWRDRLSGWE